MAELDPASEGLEFFLEKARRRQIGFACETEARTPWEIARRFGYHEPPISQMARTMEVAGALQADRPQGEKGRRFTLVPAWAPALHEAERRATTALLRPNLDLVLVDTPDLTALWRLLEKPAPREDVAWLTELRDSRRGAILAVDRGAEPTRALTNAFGGRAERLAVGETTPSHRLAELLASLDKRYA